MNQYIQRASRHSIAVRNSFVITAVTVFGIVGYFVAFWFASLMVPDAVDYFRHSGGGIPSASLNSFYLLWVLGMGAACVLGAIVGNGFYIAWQLPAASSVSSTPPSSPAPPPPSAPQPPPGP